MLDCSLHDSRKVEQPVHFSRELCQHPSTLLGEINFRKIFHLLATPAAPPDPARLGALACCDSWDTSQLSWDQLLPAEQQGP